MIVQVLFGAPHKLVPFWRFRYGSSRLTKFPFQTRKWQQMRELFVHQNQSGKKRTLDICVKHREPSFDLEKFDFCVLINCRWIFICREKVQLALEKKIRRLSVSPLFRRHRLMETRQISRTLKSKNETTLRYKAITPTVGNRVWTKFWWKIF